MNADKERKDSLLSNISNISNYNNSEGKKKTILGNFYCEEDQREMNEQMNENQTFLAHEKVEIIELIKVKKIEKAIDLI